MNVNDYIATQLTKEDEIGCENFLVNGKCPKCRYLTDDCPFNIIPKGYIECEMPKE